MEGTGPLDSTATSGAGQGVNCDVRARMDVLRVWSQYDAVIQN